MTELPTNWYVLVCGLELETSPIVIMPGLTIRSLGAELTIFDLAGAGAVGFREWAVLEPIARLCKCEIESAADANEKGQSALHRAWLASNILNLLGYCSHLGVACSSYSWSRIALGKSIKNPRPTGSSGEPLPAFHGGLLDYHMKFLTPQRLRVGALSESDCAWIADKFAIVEELIKRQEQFRLALSASFDWRFSSDQRAAVARLWSGIESLFGVTSELSFRISAMSASLLEPRGKTRISRYAGIKRLYNCRSKALHGEKLSDGELDSTIDESFELLRQLLLRVVDQGRLFTNDDLDSALFC